jgi:hypothetical protein
VHRPKVEGLEHQQVEGALEHVGRSITGHDAMALLLTVGRKMNLFLPDVNRSV